MGHNRCGPNGKQRASAPPPTFLRCRKPPLTEFGMCATHLGEYLATHDDRFPAKQQRRLNKPKHERCDCRGGSVGSLPDARSIHPRSRQDGAR